MDISNIEHLVLSGGGLLGISYIGLFKLIEENNSKLEDNISNRKQIKIKSITGCSAGAIFGTLYAIGYKSFEIQNLMHQLKLKEYLSINADSIINFFRLKGLDTVTKTINTIKTWIVLKTKDDDITFKQFYEKYNINLQIGITNITTLSFELMNWMNSPNIPIHLAISASICIPFLFEPIVIGDNIYCDGGVSNNLPIEYILNELECYPEATPEATPEVTPEVTPEATPEVTPEATPEVTPEAKPEAIKCNILAIYLMNEDNIITKDNYKECTVNQYINNIIQSVTNEYIKNKNYKISKYYKIIKLTIPCDIMTFIKLNATHEDINNIIDIAYNAIQKEINCQ